MTIECPNSPDKEHVWVRRRDGKECIECGQRQFGSSDLTLAERAAIRRFAELDYNPMKFWSVRFRMK